MKRRNVLLGLGTAAAGSGMVFGSGAFTQVEAERTINIDLARDNAAGVELRAGSSAGGGFAAISNGSNSISINLGKEKINSNATLTVGDPGLKQGNDSVSASDIGSDGKNVAFGIIDNTDSLTDDKSGDATKSLGITVDVDAGEANELTVDFFGDSDDKGLSETVTVNGEANNSFGSSDNENTADSSITANFLLNSGATNVSESAAGRIKLETGSNTGSNAGSITVTAELVDADKDDYSSVS